jgi:hypothetical protein
MKQFFVLLIIALGLALVAPLYLRNLPEPIPVLVEEPEGPAFESSLVSAVPQGLLNEARAYLSAHRGSFSNQRYITIIDFSKSSSESRMFIVDLATGAARSLHVAHGSGSDPDNDGYATRFSNASGSNASSLGFYRTGETYQGKHGLSLRLDGLSSTNSNVRSRAVVVHGANYVYDSNTRAGRSWGCFAVSMANRGWVVSALKGGSLIYAAQSR